MLWRRCEVVSIAFYAVVGFVRVDVCAVLGLRLIRVSLCQLNASNDKAVRGERLRVQREQRYEKRRKIKDPSEARAVCMRATSPCRSEGGDTGLGFLRDHEPKVVRRGRVEVITEYQVGTQSWCAGQVAVSILVSCELQLDAKRASPRVD